MRKCIIGIIQSYVVEDDNPYNQYYKQAAAYTSKIYKFNAIPVGIMIGDNKLDYDLLKICDGFIIIGGNKIEMYIYDIIDYCIQFNKPLLGICMGAEAIDIYSCILEYKNQYYDKVQIYNYLKEKFDGSLLKELPEGNLHNNDYFDKFEGKLEHIVYIDRDSIAFDIYKTDKILVPSMHLYDFKHVGNSFKISGRAEDNVCEIIEYNNSNYFIVGVHFHPEIMKNDSIFDYLIKESLKRKGK